MGKNTVEAKQWLHKRYGDSAPGKSTIIDCYAEFNRGRTNTDDAERSGRPKSATVPENITKVHKIVLRNRKLKLREIADTLKISEGSVFIIMHESLVTHKLFSKWVPRLLTSDKKQQRVEDSERCLEPLMQKKKVLFHQDNVPCHKSMKTMVKLNELSFELLPHPPYSPDLAPNDYLLFADLKKMLQEKRFGSNEEVITEAEAYFESKDESFCKKGIEMLEKRWNEFITLEGNYVHE